MGHDKQADLEWVLQKLAFPKQPSKTVTPFGQPDKKVAQDIKKGIQAFLKDQGLPKSSPYVVGFGAGLYLQGIRPKFKDVDVFIPNLPKPKVTKTINGLKIDASNSFSSIKPGIEEQVLANKEVKFGLPLMDLATTLDVKQTLNRRKDQKDIKAIQQVISPLPPLGGVKSFKERSAEQEMEAWKKWKEGGKKPEDLDRLLYLFNDMIQSKVNQYRGQVEVPEAAIELEHKRAAVKAFEQFDPSKGKLSSWVPWYLKKGRRFVETRKNVARIPENISDKIGAFNSVKSELAERLGHEPDDQAIHDFVIKTKHPKLSGISLKDIGRINREQRKDLLVTGQDGSNLSTQNFIPREQEVIRLIVPQLTPEERVVHQYTFGLNGHPELKPGEIAKKTGFDNSKVSKLRASIRNKVFNYLEP
jgi:DNA-directed RNA polymerase specialized sigma subunit